MSPQITLNGKKYTALAPKMKLVKQCMHLKEVDTESEAGWDSMVGIIVTAFNRPEITADAISDGLDLADLMPTINSIMTWIGEIMNHKNEQFPNAGTPPAA
jgi:hypothetical protein